MIYKIVHDNNEELPVKNYDLCISITGSRTIQNNQEKIEKSREILYNEFTSITKSHKDKKILIITGGSKGVDKIAETLADKIFNLDVLIIRPNYKKYFSKAAPLKRNKLISELADILIVIQDTDSKSSGTLDTFNHFKKRKQGQYRYYRI